MKSRALKTIYNIFNLKNQLILNKILLKSVYMKLDKTISFILLILLVVAIAATVYITVNPKSGEKFTEFYILGAGDKAGNYPTNLTLGKTGNVTIGIVNHEQSKTNYNLVIKFNGTIIDNRNVTLAKNETQQIPFTFTTTQSGNNQKLEFLLFKLPDNSQAYRSLILYVNVS